MGNENLNWLFSTEDCNIALSKSLYQVPLDACYKCGGNTILRSRDHRILIGIDHAALGFGTIAAHGHADALSFQMYVNPFEMKVQGIDRTLADKVFAVCDYYLQGKVAKHSRHLYDIYKLLPLVPQDENFKELVKEVRAVREQSVICPSALPEANVPELLEKIIKEKAYKQDYDSLTTQLLEENVPYDTVIATLKKVAESSIFENN